MEIKIRPQEPVCTLSFSKAGWLTILSFLTQTSEQSANDDIEKILVDKIQEIRSFILSKNEDEHVLSIDRESCLDLYLHFVEFKDSAKEETTVLDSVALTLKNFLVREVK